MFRRILLIGMLVAGSLAAAAAPVAAKDGDRIYRGDCTGAANWKLKLSPENGRIEVEFEVDQNRVGKPWRVVLRHNDTKVWSGTRTTRAPSGSFSVEVLRPNRSGTDRFVAKATNLNSGQVCRAVGTF